MLTVLTRPVSPLDRLVALAALLVFVGGVL